MLSARARVCYDPQMLRRVDYRIAINLFVFTGLWFVIGAIVLWSPVPDALGIGGGLFVMWLLLFFGVLAVAGSALTLAAINVAFPDAHLTASQNLEPRTKNRSTASQNLQPGTPRPAAGGGASGVQPHSATAPARTRKPAVTPMWAPPQVHTDSPESMLPPPPDAPPRTRRTQRGDA